MKTPNLRSPFAGWYAIRNRFGSWRIDRRTPPVLVGALGLMLVAMAINISVGEYPIPLPDVLRTLFGLPTGNADYSFIVTTLRLPRMLVAALVGLALGIAGAITQGLTRNPLAEPGILGISAGASFAAVALIVVVRTAPTSAVPVAALAGAISVALVIYLLAWRGGDSPIRLILVGIGLGAICNALTTLMITFGDIYDVQRAIIWLTGSVYGRSWPEFWSLAGWVAVFVPLALGLARDLNALHLGEEVAYGLGTPVVWRRGLLLITAVALASATVAAAGAVGFVGLMAPHIARRLVGPDQSGVLPAAGVLGALIVVVADLIGRTIFAPIELPVGLITAVVGAPFFISLLWMQARA
ncbi:iron ABC transporter permease [Chloroflexus sp.]|uniref:FecCD family ABC transporter permease n=1 Tax=Chloroflexus sp. TaxID=1904827 RepID=UPI00298F3622|nr:iron ABC transporter permease [Chloroflexus sp.]MCX7858531.1 iron ABC transporter permease [Chloroflexus sp.]MDW8403717.1 iron ABC transporter permease [Chloroflexus sp.]